MKKYLMILLNVLVFAGASIRLSSFPNDGSLFIKLLYAIILVKAGFNIEKALKKE